MKNFWSNFCQIMWLIPRKLPSQKDLVKFCWWANTIRSIHCTLGIYHIFWPICLGYCIPIFISLTCQFTMIDKFRLPREPGKYLLGAGRVQFTTFTDWAVNMCHQIFLLTKRNLYRISIKNGAMKTPLFIELDRSKK